jgi:hypothetical protein
MGTEMFHKNLWDELHKDEGEKKLDWRKMTPKKLIGTKGPRPRM